MEILVLNLISSLIENCMKSIAKVSYFLIIGIIFPTIIHPSFILAQNPYKPDSKGKMVFLTRYISEYNLSEDELKSMQFYTSKKISLKVSTLQTQVEKDLSSSSLSTENVTQSSEISIPAYTPGVVSKKIPGGLAIDFGSGIIIEFIDRNMVMGNLVEYSVDVLECRFDYVVKINGLEYKTYYLGFAYLLTDPLNISTINKVEYQKSVAPGKRVKNE